jgi:3-deoxy-D-manno-octulosonate 8-phosphate phosphatase (KDO 8-P phosphatase)
MTERPSKPDQDELTTRAARVRLLVFDVDGVLTDGGLYYGEAGELMKRFDVKDGHGLVMARLAGLKTALLTARSSAMVEIRAQELKLDAVLQGRKNKGAGLKELLAQLQVPAAECAYMGDDVNDLGPMAQVGLAACPSDAAAEVRQEAHYVARNRGGHGAARELIELCLRASGRWESTVQYMRDPESAQGVRL